MPQFSPLFSDLVVENRKSTNYTLKTYKTLLLLLFFRTRTVSFANYWFLKINDIKSAHLQNIRFCHWEKKNKNCSHTVTAPKCSAETTSRICSYLNSNEYLTDSTLTDNAVETVCCAWLIAIMTTFHGKQ